MSMSLWPHGLHHFCPSLSPGVCSNSCPLSGWCNPTISSFVPPLLLFLSSIFPSISVFSKESALHIRWSKHWSFSISPSNEYSELISFIIDWLDLLAVQGTLKSLICNINVIQCINKWRIKMKNTILNRLGIKKTNFIKIKVLHDRWKSERLSHDQIFATPWTGGHQAPLSMEFSSQEYSSGFPFPSPGDFPYSGSDLGLLHCRQILY